MMPAQRPPRLARHLSCQGCRVRKMKCSRTFPCSTCKIRGEPCTWVDAIPTRASEDEQLEANQAEVRRLRKLCDHLLYRLEETDLKLAQYEGPRAPIGERFLPYNLPAIANSPDRWGLGSIMEVDNQNDISVLDDNITTQAPAFQSSLPQSLLFGTSSFDTTPATSIAAASGLYGKQAQVAPQPTSPQAESSTSSTLPSPELVFHRPSPLHPAHARNTPQLEASQKHADRYEAAVRELSREREASAVPITEPSPNEPHPSPMSTASRHPSEYMSAAEAKESDQEIVVTPLDDRGNRWAGMVAF